MGFDEVGERIEVTMVLLSSFRFLCCIFGGAIVVLCIEGAEEAVGGEQGGSQGVALLGESLYCMS